MAPPDVAELGDGTRIDLIPLARRLCDRHLERHPEDVQRYGHALAFEWCVHDSRHMLVWAIEDRDLQGQVRWLANVLEARGYPVSNLVDNVLQGAEIVSRELPDPAGEKVAGRMRAAVDGLGAEA